MIDIDESTRYTTGTIQAAIDARHSHALALVRERKSVRSIFADANVPLGGKLRMRVVNDIVRHNAWQSLSQESRWLRKLLPRERTPEERAAAVESIDDWLERQRQRMPTLYCGDDDALGERMDDALQLRAALVSFDNPTL